MRLRRLQELCDQLTDESTNIHLYRTLNLTSEGITDSQVILLANSLRNNKSVVRLYLPWNSIGPQGVKALSSMLEVNSTIQSLNLDSNKIGNVGCIMLAEALEQDRISLRELYLAENEVTSEAIISLAEALQFNTSLTRLSLARNDIDTDGAMAMSRMIQENNSLTWLWLGDGQCLQNAAKEAVLKSLEKNYTLRRLMLTGFDSEQYARVQLYLGMNKVWRRLLPLEHVPDALWPIVLGRKRVRHHLDSLYCFVQAKPFLFAASEKAAKKSDNARKAPSKQHKSRLRKWKRDNCTIM